MKRLIALFMFGLAIAVLSFGVANADTVLVTGDGAWGDYAYTADNVPVPMPVTLFTSPGESWSFTFDLPNPIASNPTSEATGFSYLLNGSPVSTPPLQDIQFFPAADGGGFNMDFTDGSQLQVFSADVGSSLTLLLGTFSAQLEYPVTDDLIAVGSGTITLSSTAVPEPCAMLLFASGLAGLAAYRKKFRA